MKLGTHGAQAVAASGCRDGETWKTVGSVFAEDGSWQTCLINCTAVFLTWHTADCDFLRND